MSVHNQDIAAAFDEMADLLAIQGENPFLEIVGAARAPGAVPVSEALR